MEHETSPPAEGDAAAPAAEGAGIVAPSDDSVALEVEVPTEARVFVNGHETTSTGAMRRFVSRGLEPGYSYSYEVRAEVERDGKTLTETKVVKLVGGQAADLSFDFSAGTTSEENVANTPADSRTTLLLRVPANAKVFLAGHETQSTGTVRQFSTTRLPNGQNWADYTVRVELEQDGQTLTKEQKISLAAGETTELNVEFDTASIAQVSR